MAGQLIEIGKARRIITPQVPVSLAGYFNVRMWNKVLDDLEVHAVVFRKEKAYFGILQCDLVAVPLSVCDLIFSQLRKKGITLFDRGNLMICATHTHTGPEIRPGKRGGNPDYIPFLAERAAEAVEEALAGLKPGELFHTAVSDSRFLFNRRFWMKNGSVVTNPGRKNPEILRPEGDIDPEIPMLGVRCGDRWELLIASIVNHADTIGGNGVSADWHGFFRRAVERSLGDGCMAVALTGAAGNINHFDLNSEHCQTCYEEATRIGNGYAETVLKAVPGVLPVESGAFQILSGEVGTLPHEISAEEIREARAVIEKYPDEDVDAGADMTSEDLAKGVPAVLKYFASVLLGQAENHEVQHLYLNGVLFGKTLALVSLPAEPFTEIGLYLRKEIFRGITCLVSEQANGTGSLNNCGGYIPNSWNYGRGGYETTPRSNPYSRKTAALLLRKWTEIAADALNR